MLRPWRYPHGLNPCAIRRGIIGCGNVTEVKSGPGFQQTEGSHLDHALRVCAAGKPAYVEKPMARNETECAEMTKAFIRARLPLFVAYYRRALPRFLKARRRGKPRRYGFDRRTGKQGAY